MESDEQEEESFMKHTQHQSISIYKSAAQSSVYLDTKATVLEPHFFNLNQAMAARWLAEQ